MKFTEAAIENLKAKAERYDVWHPALKGFGVRISPKGAKSWIVAFRAPGSTTHSRYTLGTVGRMTLKDARRLASDALDDPAAFVAGRTKVETVEPADTFGALALQFLDHGKTRKGRTWRAATKREHTRALLSYLKALHDMPVAEVNRRDAAAQIRAIGAKHEVTAVRVRASGMSFYGWLNQNGFVDDGRNPFLNTPTYETPMRVRTLEDDEIRAIWAHTDPATEFGLSMRLCFWTGCRISEAGGMCHSELRKGVWTIPGTRTKNRRALVLILPQQAVAALEAWPGRGGRDQLFGYAEAGFQQFPRHKAKLDLTLKFAKPWRLHDVRRSVKTRMSELGIDKEIRDRILNHAIDRIEATYNQDTFAEKKAHALQRWADELDRITGPAPDANVLAFQAA